MPRTASNAQSNNTSSPVQKNGQKNAQKNGQKNAQKAVERLASLVQSDMMAVNQTILDKMQSPVALIPTLAGHLIASGGKRLRPMLTVATGKMLDLAPERPIRLAACVEFIHTATLLHDDVVDESSLRRGKKTANDIWGNQASVLVGDFLFSRSFELMIEDGSLETLKILSHASNVIAEGEVLQLANMGNVGLSRAHYYDVIRAKTAALFKAACMVVGAVKELDKSGMESLGLYGEGLGIAFQIVDDILDYSAEEALLGKTIGDDFREGKMTLPLIIAYENSNEKERLFWQRVIQQHDQKEGDFDQAMALLKKYDALTTALDEAREQGRKAKEALHCFPQNPARIALEDIIDFCLSRAY